MTNQFIKDPAARLDFAFDLKPKTHGRVGARGDWLTAGETVTGYRLEGDGLAVEDGGEADGVITAWVSGGAAGATCRVWCTFLTSAGRADRRGLVVVVRER